MMGVIIGCLAIFLIGSITNGFKIYLNSEMAGLIDASLITIYPNYESLDPESGMLENEDDFTTTLSQTSVEQIESFPFITQINPVQSAFGETTFRGHTIYQRVVSTDFEVSQPYELLTGTYPTANSREILLGYEVAKELLGYTWEETPEDEVFNQLINRPIRMALGYESYDEEGNVIRQKKTSLKIVGIISPTQQKFSYDTLGDDELVLELLRDSNPTASKDELDQILNTYERIEIRIDNPDYLASYEQQLQSLGFQTSSSKDAQRSMEGMLLGVSVILGSLAGISLLVAALGITNTMDMAIYERNKEIGVMKVVGGSLKDIRYIFVGEACAISATGGIISILIGSLLAAVINIACRTLSQELLGLQINAIVIPSFGLIIGIILFSLTIGFIAGIMPANKAVKVDVITAIK